MPVIDKSVLNIEIGWRDPFDVARRLADVAGFAFLDSALFHQKLGRYSFIGIEPFGSFTVSDGQPAWNGTDLAAPPLEALRGLLRRFALSSNPGSLPFQTGVIGAIPYEFGWQLDGLRTPGRVGRSEEPVRLGFYDLILGFDQLARRAFILSSGFPEEDAEKRYRRAVERVEQARALIDRPVPAFGSAKLPEGGWRSNFTANAYYAAVEKVRAHIFAGDIYQANIAQRFEIDLPSDFSNFAFYERLRAANPAPFGAYLSFGETAVASSSPELLLRKRGAFVETRPIKGTIRRGTGPEEDAWRGEVLRISEKDRAENIMIVDLLRNDLSRVCRPYSVDVPVLCGLETYANVHHLVSVVTGELDENKDAVDLVAAAFPGGSITGAPKRRSMEVIDAVEETPRGYYCGSILYIGFDGTADLNIAIRTAVLKPGKASFHAGGGITYLSDPVAEYAETYDKVRRLFDAFAAPDEREQTELEKASP